MPLTTMLEIEFKGIHTGFITGRKSSGAPLGFCEHCKVCTTTLRFAAKWICLSTTDATVQGSYKQAASRKRPLQCQQHVLCVQTYTVQSKSNEQAASKTEALKRTAAAQDVRRNTLESSEEFDARVSLTSNSLTTEQHALRLTMLHVSAWVHSALNCGWLPVKVELLSC